MKQKKLYDQALSHEIRDRVASDDGGMIDLSQKTTPMLGAKQATALEVGTIREDTELDMLDRGSQESRATKEIRFKKEFIRNELSSKQAKHGLNPILSPENMQHMEPTQRTQNNFNRMVNPTPFQGLDTWTGQSSGVGSPNAKFKQDEKFIGKLIENIVTSPIQEAGNSSSNYIVAPILHQEDRHFLHPSTFDYFPSRMRPEALQKHEID